jgi:hypothetical protein
LIDLSLVWLLDMKVQQHKMGWKNEKGEHMEWASQTTEALIEIIYNRVKKKQLQESTFKTEI